MHLPTEPNEKTRIYRYHGEVRQDLKTGEQVTYMRGRLFPGARLSRSFGDILAHQVGVTAEPQISVVPVDTGDLSFTIVNENAAPLINI